MSNEVKLKVAAQFDDGGIEKSLSRLDSTVDKLSKTISKASKIKISPIDKDGSADKSVLQLTETVNKLTEAMSKAGKTSFNPIDKNSIHDIEKLDRKLGESRRRSNSFSERSHWVASNEKSFGSIAGHIANTGLRSTGSVGGVIANSANAALSGGIGAGAMGFVGGMAALAVGNAIGAVKQKIDVAGQEGIGYDTLKRTLGDVNVSFEELKSSLRYASYSIGITFEESTKLASDFAKLSGISKDQYNTLSKEISIGGGFGRSAGIDPSQSNQFFAQMRQFGVTKDADGSRDLAIKIAEAVNKSGSPAKTEEMLQVISSFVANQARASLSAPNVAGYSGMLSGMVSSRIPGLDPQGAAALLGRVNSSIVGGGSAGEAGQNFLYSVLGKGKNLDPVQIKLLQQQGAFGTGRMAFSGQLSKDFYKKFGGGVSDSAANSDEMNLPTILAGLQKRYAGNSSLLLSATAGILGVNERQAMALHGISPEKINGMSSRMGRLGLDLKQMSDTNIVGMANIEGGKKNDLIASANSLLTNKDAPLSGDQADKLRMAMGGDPEKLKDILTTLMYTREQEKTNGTDTRRAIQEVEKRAQELATGLVGPTNDIRNAMVFMAGGGKKSLWQMNKELADLDYNEKSNPLKSRRTEIERLLKNSELPKDGVVRKGFSAYTLTKEELENNKKYRDSLLEEQSSINKSLEALDIGRGNKLDSVSVVGSTNKKEFEEKYGAAAERAGKSLGVDKSLILGQWGLETRWGKSIIPGTNNLGNIKDFTGGGISAVDNMNRSTDKYRKYSSPDAYADDYISLIKRRYPGAVGAGSSSSRFASGLKGYAEDPDYSEKIEQASRGLFSTPMPGGKKTQNSVSDTKFTHDINVNLYNQNGVRAADPVRVNSVVRAPIANGVR